jgi:hypothetical protein
LAGVPEEDGFDDRGLLEIGRVQVVDRVQAFGRPSRCAADR